MKSGTVGVEIGGTKLQIVLFSPLHEVVELRRGRVEVAAGAPGILHWIGEQLPQVLAAARSDHALEPDAIGVGFGGPIKTDTGTILVSHQIAGWQGFALKTWMEDQFGLPTVVANDANAAGWAEYKLGAGKGTRNFVYNNIGSGIGGALVVEGRLYDGQGLGACEIGHTRVPDWTVASPGANDKLENLCSGWAIERRIRTWKLAGGSVLHELAEGDATKLTCAMLGEAAGQGDAASRQEIARIARGVGTALANVITLLHPERIAMGGGVSLMGDVLLDPIRAAVAEMVFGVYRDHYEIVPCALGENVVLDGAVLLAREALGD